MHLQVCRQDCCIVQRRLAEALDVQEELHWWNELYLDQCCYQSLVALVKSSVNLYNALNLLQRQSTLSMVNTVATLDASCVIVCQAT